MYHSDCWVRTRWNFKAWLTFVFYILNVCFHLNHKENVSTSFTWWTFEKSTYKVHTVIFFSTMKTQAVCRFVWYFLAAQPSGHHMKTGFTMYQAQCFTLCSHVLCPTRCCWAVAAATACSSCSCRPWRLAKSLSQKAASPKPRWRCACTRSWNSCWVSHRWWHSDSCWSKPWSSWQRKATQGCGEPHEEDLWPLPSRSG